jgi:hypothetical protein
LFYKTCIFEVVKKRIVMKKIISCIVLVALGFVSCKQEEETNVVSTNPETSAFSDDFKGPTAEPTTPSTAAAQPGAPMMTTPNGMVTPTTAQPVKVGKGMNPAHGQPGHVCSVPVGAPLNSAASKTTTASTQSATITSAGSTPGTVTQNGATITTTNNNIPATIAAPVETAPGMNPPHGQEGHVCSVAVGAPLPKKE